MYVGLHVKYPLFLWEFKWIWIISTYFRSIFKQQISWKSTQWKPRSSMQKDGQKHVDMTKIMVAFRNFAKALKIYYLLTYLLHGAESFLRS